MRCRPMRGRRWSSSGARERGCGTPRARSTSTSSPGSRSTTPVTATRGSSPRSRTRRSAWGASPTSTTRSRRCASASGSPSRAWAARSSSATRARRPTSARSSWRESTPTRGGSRIAGDRRPRRRLPRPDARCAGGDAEAGARGPVRAPAGGLRLRLPRDDPDALRAAVGERTAAVMIEPIQGEAGVFPIADEVLLAAREACDDRGRRCSSWTRSSRGWGGPGRCGPTSSSRCART